MSQEKARDGNEVQSTGGDPSVETGEASGEEASGEGAGSGLAAEELREEVRRELEELDALRDRHLRLAAEFDNYRKRTRGELTRTREAAQADLIGRLLDALDDLDRVSNIPADSTTAEALLEGVELVERKMFKELREAGLERVEAEGAGFDPQVHEAMVTVPTDDPALDETVSRVFVEGYRFRDRLVRAARVEVRKYEPETGSGDSS